MRKRIAWLALAILSVILGTLWASCGLADAPQPTSTVGTVMMDWHSLGGPYERVAFALAYDRATQMLYVGTWGHGLYSSWNAGQDWEPVNTAGMRYVRALGVSPLTPAVIFAGTYGEGLHSSTDGGWTWKQLGRRGCLTLPRKSEHPQRTPRNIESLLVFADQGTERILAGTHNGVCSGSMTSDTWTHLNDGFPDTDEAYYINALARDPEGRLCVGTRDGLYCSQDDGEKWWKMGPPEGYPDEARHILSLTVVTSTTDLDSTLLIGTRGAGIYALEDFDSGAWAERTAGFPDDPDAWRIQALLHTRDGKVYAGTVDNGVLVSTDGGWNWMQRWDGLPVNARSVTSLTWDPDTDTVYAGTYGDGVYRLDAGDESAWQAANEGLPVDFAVQEIAFAGSSSEQLLTGLRVGGMYLYKQQKQDPAWQRLPEALPIGQARDVAGLAVTGRNQETVIVAAGTGIFRGSDADHPWQHLGSENGLPEGGERANALAQGRQNPEILYAAEAAGEGLYRSDDGGASWRPVVGDLDESLRTYICCLAVGSNDDTVYIGVAPGQGTVYQPLQARSVYTRQVYLTQNGGVSWQPLSPIEGQTLEGLAWSQRTAWDVFLYGGQREMLYARTKEGIYVSYDNGQSWRLRLRGVFRDLLTDPYRPWITYVASPGVILTKEFESPIDLTSELWISYDGGETWTWAGPGPRLSAEMSPASITTLAFDPNDFGRLYAGTEGAGIFWRELPSHMRAFTPRAVALIVILILLLAVVVFILWTGLTLGQRHGLPPSTWLRLAFLRTFHSTELHLVSDRHTPLTALECLVFALMPDKLFQLKHMWRTLNEKNIPTDLNQVEMALKRLTVDYNLLRSSEGEYRQLLLLLGRIARSRFWDDAEQRERLIKEIEGQSRLRADIRRFFKLADFETFSFEAGFTVRSHQPEYTLLGADRGIYVHLHTVTAEAFSLQKVRDNAYRAYEGQLAGRTAFLIVTHCPPIETLREIVNLRWEDDFRPVLLPYNHVRYTVEKATSCQVLNHSLRRSLGDQDLFTLDEPARNPLDFFGRESYVQRLVENCENGQVTGLTGIAKVGKTSLLWQVMDRLSTALVALLELNWPSARTLYSDIRRQWLATARVRFPTWEQPQQELPVESITADQIAADLTALRASFLDQGLATSLVALIDGLPDPQTGAQILEPLARAIAATPNVSLICVFSRPAQSDMFELHLLLPFEQEDSVGLVNALATQMGFGFDEVTAEYLHRASGGHPLLLRQLASRSVAQKQDTDNHIWVADVEQATESYIARRESALRELWESLTEEEQSIVLAAITGKTLPDSDLLGQLESLGWLRPVYSRWELFSQALSRWLEARHPHRL